MSLKVLHTCVNCARVCHAMWSTQASLSLPPNCSPFPPPSAQDTISASCLLGVTHLYQAPQEVKTWIIHHHLPDTHLHITLVSFNWTQIHSFSCCLKPSMGPYGTLIVLSVKSASSVVLQLATLHFFLQLELGQFLEDIASSGGFILPCPPGSEASTWTSYSSRPDWAVVLPPEKPQVLEVPASAGTICPLPHNCL